MMESTGVKNMELKVINNKLEIFEIIFSIIAIIVMCILFMDYLGRFGGEPKFTGEPPKEVIENK